jgi:predicted transposase YbfD/YdcC
MEDPTRRGPLRFFELLPDPRAANVRHRLIDLLVITLCGMICGADGWSELEDFAEAKEPWFATFLDLKHGVPSADTFRRVISRLDPEEMERCFMNWMSSVVETSQGRLLAIDGKSIRRSFEHGWDKIGMAHMVSVFAAANGQTLGQLKTEGKGQELEGIRQLLGLVDLKDATVTIDALGCQKHIAQQITDAGGEYVLAVKENQPKLHQQIKVEMDDMIRSNFQGVWHDRHEDTDAGHGRIERRRLWCTDELNWLRAAADWPALRSVVCIEAEREVLGQGRSRERRYYITSLAPDAERLSEAIRSHWGIENRLHHVLDVSFHEDDSRVRRDHGPENLSRLRRMALNLLRNADHLTKRKSIKGRRKIAGWDHDFLLRLITG